MLVKANETIDERIDPPATAWEPLLRECVHELRRGFWLLFFMMVFVGLLALRVTMDANPPAPVAEYVGPEVYAQFGWRGAFDSVDERPRWVEIRFSTDGVTQ